MGRSAAYIAPIKFDGATSIVTGEHDTPIESVIAVPIDEPELQQEIGGISQQGQVAPQRPSGCVSDIQLADEPGIMQASAGEVVQGFAVPVELALVENDSFPKNLIFSRLRQAELSF